MNYRVFCKKKPNSSKILNIFIVLLLVFCIPLFILIGSVDLIGTTVCKAVIWCSFILFMLKFVIERKDVIFNNKNANRIFIEKPIVIDSDNNIYILQGKTGMLLLISAIFPLLMVLFTKHSEDFLYYFVMFYLVLISVVMELLINADVMYLKKNEDNLYNIINNQKLKFKVIKVLEIKKNENGSYMVSLDNGVNKEVFFDRGYENYEVLIDLINGKCVS